MSTTVSVETGWKIFWYAARFYVWPAGRKGSLRVAAEEMYRLNLFARSTGRHPITDQIYMLKNGFIRYLYQHGYCTEVKLHSQKRECYTCEGTGEYWTGEECYRCHGTGVYSVTELYAFRFEIHGQRFAWHQLKKYVDYDVVVTPGTVAEPLPELRKDEAILSLAEAWKGCCIVWWAMLWHGQWLDLMLFAWLRTKLRVVLMVDAIQHSWMRVRTWWQKKVSSLAYRVVEKKLAVQQLDAEEIQALHKAQRNLDVYESSDDLEKGDAVFIGDDGKAHSLASMKADDEAPF